MRRNALNETSRYDDQGRPRNWRDQIVPHQMNAVSFMQVPDLLAQFKEIPGDFWVQDVNDEGDSVALISCPCGHTPEVTTGGLSECTCHRFFLSTGQRVLAANRPKQYADEPVDAANLPDD